MSEQRDTETPEELSIEWVVSKVQRLDRWTQWTEAAQAVYRWACEVQVDRLLRLAGRIDLENEIGDLDPVSCEFMVEHIESSLALVPGLEQAKGLLELLLRPRRPIRPRENLIGDRRRYFASLLANGKDEQTLSRFIADSLGSPAEQSRSLLICLAQEMILRGLGNRHSLAGVQELAATIGSPMAWLPWRLSAVEQGHRLRIYHQQTDGLFSSCCFGIRFPCETPALCGSSGPNRRTVTGRETTTLRRANQITTAVSGWQQRSNGKLEARTYALGQSVQPEDLPWLLCSLELGALSGVADSIRVIPVTLSQTWAALFAASSCGGAYGYGDYDAWARLNAWSSLAGLAGCPSGADFAEVEQSCRAANWFRFEKTGPWFYPVEAWDLGIVALDGRSLAVLAATDTD